MSTLTKVFVVMLVVSSIAFTTVAVSISAQTTRWKAAYDAKEKEANVADVTIRNLHAGHAAQVATLRDTLNSQQARLAALEGDLESVRKEASAKEASLKQMQAERANLEAMNRGLLGQLQVSNSNGESFRQQRDRMEAASLDLQTRNIHLTERVNDQTAQIAVLMEQRRQFEQQLEMLKRENSGLSRQANRLGAGATMEDPKGVGLPGVTAAAPVSSSAVRGKVLGVEGNIVTLSVGSADGVERDMVFVIRRSGEYIGDVTINAVEPNQSAGRLTRQRLAPQASDEVIDLSHLASSRG
ncbi:MAG: hypothetical protein IT449_06115 [Phycisphaerales bacterium]|nr:hypothetical protein [Phycisphaerales bacterium]